MPTLRLGYWAVKKKIGGFVSRFSAEIYRNKMLENSRLEGLGRDFSTFIMQKEDKWGILLTRKLDRRDISRTLNREHAQTVIEKVRKTLNTEINKLEMARLIDTEGSIYYRDYGGRYLLVVALTSKSRRLTERFAMLAGGVNVHPAKKSTWIPEATGYRALEIIRNALPHMLEEERITRSKIALKIGVYIRGSQAPWRVIRREGEPTKTAYAPYIEMPKRAG